MFRLLKLPSDHGIFRLFVTCMFALWLLLIGLQCCAATEGVARQPLMQQLMSGDGDDAAMAANKTPAPQRATQPKEQARQPKDETLAFNFRYAPWEDVLKWYADEAGLTLDLNEVPQGTFNYYDTEPRSLEEALDVLNGYLLPKGYLLVRRDNFLTSVNIEDGIPPNLVPSVSLSELSQRGENEILSVVFPLQGVNAREAKEQIDQLVGPQGSVTALTGSNAVAVTDVGSNLKRIRNLLEENLALGGADSFRSFPLEHLTASEARKLIIELFSTDAGGMDSTGTSTNTRRALRRGATKRGNGEAEDVRVAISPRTNSVLVRAEPNDLMLIGEMLDSVDVPSSASTPGMYGPSVRVIPLTHVNSGHLESLPSLLPGVTVSMSGGNVATPRDKVPQSAPARTVEPGQTPNPAASKPVQPRTQAEPLSNDDDRDD